MESSWLRHTSVIWRCSCRRSRFDEYGEKGHEAFGANAIGGVPDQEERVLDFRSVMARAGTLKCVLHLSGMVEEPHGVLAMVSCRCCKGIKQLVFLL